jgi:hypothetical protein
MQRKLSTGIVLLRVKGQKASDKIKLLAGLFERHSDKLVGSFTVLSKDKVRILPSERRQ